MRIGIFSECYKPIINGVVNSVVDFKQGLEAMGHEVFIFCPTYKNYKDEPNDRNIVHLKSWPIPGNSGYHYIFPTNWVSESIVKDLDIIHAQHPFIMGQRALKLAKKYNKPLVFTNHTQYENYNHYIPLPASWVKKIIGNYLTKFLSNCNMIVAPAKGIVKTLLKYKPKTPIEIVANGIDVNRFANCNKPKSRDEIIKKYKLNDWPILIFTGRIAKEKNLDFLFKAFKSILEKNSSIYLMLVGDGLEMNYYQQLAKKFEIDKNIIFAGAINYKDVPKYYQACDIFVTASKSEVHPLTLLEGLAAELPAVIVDAPGTGDIITDMNEGLVTKNDEKDFAKNVLRLLGDKKLYLKLSKTAYKTSKNYSIEATTLRLLEVYEQVLNNYHK